METKKYQTIDILLPTQERGKVKAVKDKKGEIKGEEIDDLLGLYYIQNPKDLAKHLQFVKNQFSYFEKVTKCWKVHLDKLNHINEETTGYGHSLEDLKESLDSISVPLSKIAIEHIIEDLKEEIEEWEDYMKNCIFDSAKDEPESDDIAATDAALGSVYHRGGL